MAAGEYVSVSSQTDIEVADIKREAEELKAMPEEELQILAAIYERRGLNKETALKVAQELTAKDALAAHVRDELGINEISQANPIQAAFASGAAFTVGGILPLLVTLFGHIGYHVRQNGWVKHKKCHLENLYLGNIGYGTYGLCWLFIWSQCLVQNKIKNYECSTFPSIGKSFTHYVSFDRRHCFRCWFIF